MDQPLPEALSERERAILTLLAEGLADREIAHRLSVAVSTVKWYARQIYAKLGVENRHEAVRYAQGVGLLADAPPALRAPALPALVSPLLGREHELSELARLVRDPVHRLITVLGPGGMGKTVLALDTGRRAMSHFADRVYFVPLAPLTTAEHIISAIAKTLDLQLNPDDPPDEQLLHYLSTRSLLLILDNFEHLLASAALLAAMLVHAPDLHLLVTSREALNLIHETRYPLHGLALPPARTEELLENSSVKLFLQSARQAQHNYVPSRDDLAAIAEICRRVGGMPLAIVLAAAWLPVLSPADMLAELGQRHDLLQGESADIPERQRSIRVIVTVAWEQLARPARDVFARLSVFRGGFTREAAEQVAGASVPILKQLVDKSLLHYTLATRRYDVHEVLRQYADQYLDGEREAIQLAHAHYFLALAERAEPALWGGADQGVWRKRLAADHENLRAALHQALDHGAVEGALRLASTLWRFWMMQGYLSEGRQWLEQALARDTPVVPMVRAKALAAVGILTAHQGDVTRAHAYLEETLALFRELGHSRDFAYALLVQAWTLRIQGDYERARLREEEGLAQARTLGFAPGVALALTGLGMDRWYQYHDGTGARALLEESLALQQALQDWWGIGAALINLGVVLREQGDVGRAAVVFEEYLGLAQEQEDPGIIATALLNLGWLALDAGDDARTARCFGEALTLFDKVGDRVGTGAALEGVASVALAQGQAVRAAQLYGGVETLHDVIGVAVPFGRRTPSHRHERLLHAMRDDPALTAARVAGRAMSQEQVVAYALEAD
ncbi:MAG TPA: LuxR C-terminal-related transcriptional regulator [Herpetosiphonaceae bacterium]|nr:LuxR C-terminal-related transcriptional regulator [Herpetosiphonaceae bacterium]